MIKGRGVEHRMLRMAARNGVVTVWERFTRSVGRRYAPVRTCLVRTIRLALPKGQVYGRVRYSILGNAMVSRMCSRPHIHAVNRSTPMPKPACGTEPYLR